MADDYCSSYPGPPPPPINPLENLCTCALEEVDKLVDEAVKKRLNSGVNCRPCIYPLPEAIPNHDPCNKDYIPPPHKCIPEEADQKHLQRCDVVRQQVRESLGKREPPDNIYESSVNAAEQALALRYGETPNVQDLIYETAITSRPGVGRLRANDLFIQGSTRDRIRAEVSFEDEPWGEFYPAMARANTIPKIIVFLEQLDEDVRAHEVLKYLSGKGYLRQEMKLMDDFAANVNEKYLVWLRSLEDHSTDPSIVSQFDSYEFARKEWLHKLRQQRELDDIITYQLNRLTPIQGMKTDTYFKKVKAGKRLMMTSNKAKEAIQYKACRADRLQEFVTSTLKTVELLVNSWGQFGTDTEPPRGTCVILEAMIRNITKKPSDIFSDLKSLFQTRRVPMFRNLQSFICTVLNQSEHLTMALKHLHAYLLATMTANSRDDSKEQQASTPDAVSPVTGRSKHMGEGEMCGMLSRSYFAENDPAITVFGRVKQPLCSDHPEF